MPEKFPVNEPVPIDEICKYVIGNCPGCGFNVLCEGDIIRMPGYIDVMNIELLQNKKLISEAKYNKTLKTFDLIIPKDILKIKSNKYYIKFK